MREIDSDRHRLAGQLTLKLALRCVNGAAESNLGRSTLPLLLSTTRAFYLLLHSLKKVNYFFNHKTRNCVPGFGCQGKFRPKINTTFTPFNAVRTIFKRIFAILEIFVRVKCYQKKTPNPAHTEI